MVEGCGRVEGAGGKKGVVVVVNNDPRLLSCHGSGAGQVDL